MRSHKTLKKLRNILSYNCKKCFFYQNNRCILSKRDVIFCDMKTTHIAGVDNIEFYVNLVNSKRISLRALYISVSSLLVSILSIIIQCFLK